jgi:hypothetical protein
MGNVSDSIELLQLAKNPFPYGVFTSLSPRPVKHLNPLDRSPQAHVNGMGGPLKFENGGFVPLIQQDLSRVEKPEKTHQEEETRDGEEEEEYEPLLETAHPKETHLIIPFGLIRVSWDGRTHPFLKDTLSFHFGNMPSPALPCIGENNLKAFLLSGEYNFGASFIEHREPDPIKRESRRCSGKGTSFCYAPQLPSCFDSDEVRMRKSNVYSHGALGQDFLLPMFVMWKVIAATRRARPEHSGRDFPRHSSNLIVPPQKSCSHDHEEIPK